MNKIKESPFLSSGVIIAFLTISGYVVAYLYEAGYCRYFNLPLQFIYVDINTILRSLFLLAIFFFIIYSCVEIPSLFLPKEKTHILFRRIFSWFLLSSVVVFSLLYIYRDLSKNFFYLILLVFLLSPALDFLLPLFRKGKYMDNFKRQNEDDLRFKSFTGRIVEIIGKESFIFLVLIFYIFICAFFYGKAEAERQKYFFTIDSKNVVVLRIYENKILALNFNPELKIVSNPLEIFNMDKKDKIKLNFKNIGRLKLEDK